MHRAAALPLAIAAVLVTAACASGAQESASAPQPELQQADAAPMTETTAADGELARPESIVTPPHLQDEGTPGLPASAGASVDDVLREGVVVTWAVPGERFVVSVPDGETCQTRASVPYAYEGEVVVRLSNSACEAPDAVRSFTMEVPEGADTSVELAVAIEGLELPFTRTLPAAP